VVTQHLGISELGFATHYIPSRRIPILLSRLAVLENVHPSVIDQTIEEFSSERQPDEPPTPFIGSTRDALDIAFRHDRVEDIIEDLESFVNHKDGDISRWATETIATLNLRSPTSLKVALKAIRNGKKMTLLEALNMELKIATAYCVSKVSICHPRMYLRIWIHGRTVQVPISSMVSGRCWGKQRKYLDGLPLR
jgi:3-hydroxyisobutyryl-CoA hydrolase